MTDQEAYVSYHKWCLFFKTGAFPRAIQNFDNFEASENRIFFQRFAETTKRNGGTVDPDVFIKALAEFHKGFFKPQCLTALASYRIYQDYVKSINHNQDDVTITDGVITSCRNVVKFCAEHNLSSLSEYLSYDLEMLPTVAKHVSAGTITHHFLACISEIASIIANYPPDCQDFFRGFDYRLAREKIIFIPKTRQIADNLEAIIAQAIINFKKT